MAGSVKRSFLTLPKQFPNPAPCRLDLTFIRILPVVQISIFFLSLGCDQKLLLTHCPSVFGTIPPPPPRNEETPKMSQKCHFGPSLQNGQNGVRGTFQKQPKWKEFEIFVEMTFPKYNPPQCKQPLQNWAILKLKQLLGQTQILAMGRPKFWQWVAQIQGGDCLLPSIAQHQNPTSSIQKSSIIQNRSEWSASPSRIPPTRHFTTTLLPLPLQLCN